MKYSVRFPAESIQKKFHKDLELIPPKIQDEIMEAIEGLADNPRPAGEPKIKPPLIVYQYAASTVLKSETTGSFTMSMTSGELPGFLTSASETSELMPDDVVKCVDCVICKNGPI